MDRLGAASEVAPLSDRRMMMKDLISSVRVEPGPAHDRVHVWNRGGKAGVLVVEKGDGNAVADRLRDWVQGTGEHR